MSLNVIYLKYFYDAARTQSVSESAELNYVSQSAISQGIRKLEASLGKSLITHQRNTFKLTREGEVVFKSSKNVFRSLDHLHESLEREEHEYGGVLDFVCSYSLSLSLLPDFLAQFHKEAPKVAIDLRLGHYGITTDLVKKGVVEFGIILDNGDITSFDKIELFKGQFNLYRKKGSTFKGEDLTFLMTEDHKETFLLKEEVDKKYGRPVQLQMQVSSWEVIANLTASGVGIGFIPDYLVKGTHREKLLNKVTLDIAPIPYKIYAIYPRNEILSRNAQKFIELIAGTH